MITQLKPTVWLRTPKGVGLCHFVIDYGEEHDLLWVVADDATGEIWTWPNTQVRFIKNISIEAPRESNAARQGDQGRRDEAPKWDAVTQSRAQGLRGLRGYWSRWKARSHR